MVRNMLALLGAALASLWQSVTSCPELSMQVLARSQGQPHNLAACAASAKEVESSEEARGKASSACQQQDPWDLALEFLWSLNHYIKVSSLAFVRYCLAPWLS